MLTIIIGVFLSIIINAIFDKILDLDFMSGCLVFCVIIASIGLGLFYPLSGYNDWKLIKETKLVSLSNSTVSGGTGSLVYVSLSADNSYTYRFEVDSPFGTKSSKKYKTATLVNDNNITEIEDSKCQEPILMEYKRTAKKSIWTFGICPETSYVFNVPDGTISKDIKLR